ncbi:M15 family metallopeptidase [Microbacterium sp. SSW1-49]|uniref:M15 family metallopeptidase n=1 Tax=Microbacterium croceum TaxID=2851645 RepID=A0ABT0FC74_9MICO|nr:M15 family metallopeptidase [Microbacterium croceum]MCK2035356.1 M15 family metallopeptidase [Microbacterium croceum]
MNSTTVSLPPRVRRRRRIALAVVGLVAAVIVAFAVQQSLAAASATVPPGQSTATGEAMPNGAIDGSVVAPSEADGVIRDGDQPTVFDVDRVAVSKLDPALLAALQRAATDAADSGVTFLVNSGWRSPVLQDRMLQDAIAHYGSEAEAARWVASSTTSAHVSGDAVDLGPLPTLDWLAQHGAGYGLCQIYANESWHYELRPDAVTQGCPQMYDDPTEDPRMHR